MSIGFVSSDPLNNLTNVYQRPVFIPAQRPPTTNDIQPAGTFWEDGSASPKLIYQTLGEGTWSLTGATASDLNTLTGDAGGAISPTANNINLLGTTDQIETTGAGATITWAIADPFIPTGDVEISGTLEVTGLTTLGALTQVGTASINGSGAATTTIGSSGGGAVAVASSTGGISIAAANGAVAITSGTGALSISGDAAATTVSIGTGAAAKTLNIGSANTTSATNLTAGSGGVNCATSFALTSVATQFIMNGGAATDFIGTGTLSSGTVTIANTNIAANDRIFIQRIAANGSTTLGELSYSISAGASFTVTSLIVGTPGSTETADTSTFSYIIFRQT